MSFTNINDPAGVAALLQSLRSSQAWADLQETAPTSQPTTPSPALNKVLGVPPVEEPEPEASTSSSVADLLAQLQNPQSAPAPAILPPSQASSSSSSSSSHRHRETKSLTPTTSLDDAESFLRESFAKREQRKDLRTLSLQQSLPVLAELSERQDCIDSIVKLRKDQDVLERQLWEERESILSTQREKVKAAVTKANIVGSGISEREAKAMTQSYEKELQRFDKDRVLPAWDGLITRQQMMLEKIGVPSMFVTNEKVDRERQQRVVQVLEGIVGGDK